MTLCAGEMNPAMPSASATVGAAPVGTSATPASMKAPHSPLPAGVAEAFEEQSYHQGDGVFLLALYLETYQISAVFPGYPKGNGVLIPLGELCNLLELGIHVDAKRGLAEGSISQNAKAFKLDLQAGTWFSRDTSRPSTRPRWTVARTTSTWTHACWPSGCRWT